MPAPLPPALATAPAPALWWPGGEDAAWERNAAADDGPAAAWREEDWSRVAQALRAALADGRTEGELADPALRWRGGPLEGGWVAWLLLPPAPAGDAALHAELARLRERIRVIDEVGRLGVWERDARSGQARWDPQIYRFFGFDPAEGPPTLERAMQRVHPDDAERLRSELFTSMQRAGRYSGRYMLQRPDGGQPLIHCIWEVRHGADGKPERVIGVMLDDTESVRDAQRRQAASTQIALAVGLVGISLWRVDLATQRINLNDWGYELIGRRPQADGMPLSEMRDCIHPDDLPAIVRAGEQALAGEGRIVDVEARYRRVDGSYRTLLTRRMAERDEQGRPIALIGVSLDVTAQVEQWRRAQQAAQSMELVAEATGVGLWTADAGTLRSAWNRQMWRLFDIPESVPLPRAWRLASQRIHPQDRARLDAAYAELAAGRPVPDELEFRIRRADGEQRWVSARGRVARHRERRVIFGMFVDVTEQRRTQERLRHAEQRAVMAARAVGLALWERDALDGEIWWDEQMYRLRGLSPDHPRTPTQLHPLCLHPDDLDFVERRTAQAMEGETDYTFDFRVRWPDGSVRWLATRGSVVRDEAGRALRIIGFNWDVTEHKRSEDMRREKAAAEQASRAKTEFLSRMSHELRTPMNAVLGFAGLLLEDPSQPLSEQQREFTEHIRNAGKHLLALIDDVLYLTTLEFGAVAVEPVLVAPLVQETLHWVAPAAREAGVSLAAGPLDGSVLADARRLRQVVTNLLSNAVKYNRPGGSAQVECITGADPAMLGLRVRDTGRGLTPAQLQRLFEPFNRLGAERENIEGTGIGLTIVRALVERMGGRVEVDSRPGEGSEFRVWLPRAPHAPPAPAHAAAPPATAAAAAAAGVATVDVLYVEDNPVNAMLLQAMAGLRPQVRLHVEADGRSGIARALQLRPAGVLIDLQLPDIDGFQVLHALRADPSLARTTFIAVSASAMPEDVARARSAGFDDYWTKPLELRHFLAGLDRIVERG